MVCFHNNTSYPIHYLFNDCINYYFLDTLSLDDEALTNSIVSLQDVLLDDQDVIVDYDRQSADTNFSDDKSLADLTIGCTEDGEDISPSCLTPDSEKISSEEHLKVVLIYI